MSAILDWLAGRLAAGGLRVGQVVCGTDFSLRHVDDAGLEGLEVFTDPEEAVAIARFDASGAYRPLKASPDLRRGWELRLASLSDVRLALDGFYPAAPGNALALERGTLRPTDLRETLARQSGMYAVTKSISDADASEVIRLTCDDTTRCRNRILWNLSPGLPAPLTHRPEDALEDPVPLLCTEACPVLVSALREKIKQDKPTGG